MHGNRDSLPHDMFRTLAVYGFWLLSDSLLFFFSVLFFLLFRLAERQSATIDRWGEWNLTSLANFRNFLFSNWPMSCGAGLWPSLLIGHLAKLFLLIIRRFILPSLLSFVTLCFPVVTLSWDYLTNTRSIKHAVTLYIVKDKKFYEKWNYLSSTYSFLFLFFLTLASCSRDYLFSWLRFLYSAKPYTFKYSTALRPHDAMRINDIKVAS